MDRGRGPAAVPLIRGKVVDRADPIMQRERSQEWRLFGSNVPKAEIVYICQIVIVYVIIITSIVNLSLNNGNPELWISLLCSAIGYALPSPSLNHGRALSVPEQSPVDRSAP